MCFVNCDSINSSVHSRCLMLIRPCLAGLRLRLRLRGSSGGGAAANALAGGAASVRPSEESKPLCGGVRSGFVASPL